MVSEHGTHSLSAECSRYLFGWMQELQITAVRALAEQLIFKQGYQLLLTDTCKYCTVLQALLVKTSTEWNCCVGTNTPNVACYKRTAAHGAFTAQPQH